MYSFYAAATFKQTEQIHRISHVHIKMFLHFHCHVENSVNVVCSIPIWMWHNAVSTLEQTQRMGRILLVKIFLIFIFP